MVRKMSEVKEIKNKEMDAYELEIEESRNEEGKIHRIVFKTNIGNISYRPYKYELKEVVYDGCKVNRRRKVLLGMDELSPMLWKLNRELQTGITKIKLSYFLWKKDDRIIRFLREKQIEEMEFMEVEEKVK